MASGQAVAVPGWIFSLLWSVVSLLTAYLIGHMVARIVCQRLSRWASKTTWKWDELIINAVQRGLPLWSFLVGLYVAIGFWPLPAPLLTTVNRIIYVFVWLSITVVCAGLVGQLVFLYGSRLRPTMPVTSLTEHVAKIFVIMLGSLMILNGLGISITPLLTALGVGGLAVALALQDTLSNLFSGFYLTMARYVRVGDYVKLESEQEGYIEDIGWRATRIHMLSNSTILVPNQKLGQAIVTNYHLPSRELAVLVEVRVDFTSDLAAIERVTTEVAREVMRTVPGSILEFEPFIRYHTFGDLGIHFTVILRAKEFVDQYLIKHEFIKRLQARYQQEGILIPSAFKAYASKDTTLVDHAP